MMKGKARPPIPVPAKTTPEAMPRRWCHHLRRERVSDERRKRAEEGERERGRGEGRKERGEEDNVLVHPEQNRCIKHRPRNTSQHRDKQEQLPDLFAVISRQKRARKRRKETEEE
jgi:hypothetical protein